MLFLAMLCQIQALPPRRRKPLVPGAAVGSR